MLARDTSETLRGETHGNSVRNSILPTYFLGYGTKPFREDSFLRYNQARTRVQGRARAPLPRQQLFFASLFLPPSFFRVLFSSSSPSAPLLSLPPLSPLPILERETRNTRYALLPPGKTVGPLLCERRGETRRGEAPASRLRRQPSESKTNVLAITAFVAEQQPFPSPLSPPLARKNWSATGEFVYSIEMQGGERQPGREGVRGFEGSVGKENTSENAFPPAKKKYHS